MRLASWLTAAAALVAWAASPAAAQVSQIARGASDSFGPGFTALSDTKVDFRLARPGHVALLWIGAAGEIDIYWPLRSRDRSERRAGRHAIGVGDVKSPIEAPTLSGAPASSQPGRFAPLGTGAVAASRGPEEVEISGYWVLIATDTPLTNLDLKTQLARLSREGGGDGVLGQLPDALLVGRVGLWALYAAPVVLEGS